MARGEIDTSTPHDAMFKGTFALPERAAALFRTKLADSLSAKIDWDTLTPVPGSFVNPNLADLYTDLLFSVQIGESELLLYLLLEHQSTVAKDMPFRMLEYMVSIWKSYRQHNRKNNDEVVPLPAIIPTLISHARGGWNEPLSYWEMIDPDPASIPELAPFVPNFELVLQDLAHLSNEELEGLALDAVAKFALVLLRDARSAEARVANLGLWLRLARDVLGAASGMEALIMFLSYLAHVIEREPFKDFCDTMLQELPQAEPAMQTYAEQLRKEGREEGLEEGREEQTRQLRESIVDLLEARGFVLEQEHHARVESCDSLATLRRWYTAAKTAADNQPVDQVLADASGDA